MTFKLGVFHLRQTNFASDEESTGSGYPVRDLFLNAVNLGYFHRIL